MSDIMPLKNIKNDIEEEYLLSNILSNGGCIRCMNKTCKIEGQHGIFFPDILSKVVLRPNYIKSVQNALENIKLDFEGKKKYYTICNYFMHSCNNCKENRTDFFTYQDKKIMFCFPVLNKSKNKVIIGIHADIEIKKINNQYEIDLLPFLPLNDTIKHKLNVSDKKSILHEIKSDEYNIIWPSLSEDNESSKSTSKLNFNNIIKKHQCDTISDSSSFCSFPNYSSCNSLNDLLIESKKTIQETIQETKIEKLNEISIEKINEKMNDSVELMNLKNDNIFLKKLCKDLHSDKNKLMNDIIYLEKKISKLKEKYEKNKFILNNNDTYNEILKNIKYLNTNVTQQFIETNYSDYILI
jgi:hypothetical protein